MDSEIYERLEKLENIVSEIIQDNEVKTQMLQKLYEENVRRLREQNQSKGMDTG